MGYPKLKQKYKRLVIKDMKELTVYSDEFKPLIEIYSGMLAQYEILINRLIEEDFNIEVETQRGGTRKSATMTATEKLRDQIVLYSDRLLLNPKALKKQHEEGENPSKLAEILSNFDKTDEKG